MSALNEINTRPFTSVLWKGLPSRKVGLLRGLTSGTSGKVESLKHIYFVKQDQTLLPRVTLVKVDVGYFERIFFKLRAPFSISL